MTVTIDTKIKLVPSTSNSDCNDRHQGQAKDKAAQVEASNKDIAAQIEKKLLDDLKGEVQSQLEKRLNAEGSSTIPGHQQHLKPFLDEKAVELVGHGATKNRDWSRKNNAGILN